MSRRMLVVLVAALFSLALVACGDDDGGIEADDTTTTVPDVGIDVYLSPTTILIAAIVGIASVAATPLFLVGRLRRMNLPGTLRVVE